MSEEAFHKMRKDINVHVANTLHKVNVQISCLQS